MNIQEAKEEIIRTVRAYLAKDEDGSYLIPRERQRPVLLMGAPGIGKTAVMRQIAEELGISLVSYTITHHTRQSAIGLPVVSEKRYGGKRCSVTEYTMSEIVASVYEQIERSKIAEGILFLDEINCVSETLAPTMLQFLQYKRFGTHEVPAGYVIVTAGNPPEYNKSVRDFDIVTLDRVRRLDVREDFPVWKKYALRQGIHGAVLSYLEIKKDRFYSVRAAAGGTRFVTARGWEDLSDSLKVYERLGLSVEREFAASFLQDPEIAEDFSIYYELYRKYRTQYRIPELLRGERPENTGQLKEAPFDEKLSLIGLLVSALGQEFQRWALELSVQRELFEILKTVRDMLSRGELREGSNAERKAGSTAPELRGQCIYLKDWLEATLRAQRAQLKEREEAQLLGREEAQRERGLLLRLQELCGEMLRERRADYSFLKQRFAISEEERRAREQETDRHLTNVFRFLAETFGEQQELVLFLSELDAGYYSLRFVQETGNEAYYRYNHILLLKDRREELKEEVMRLL